MELSQEIILHCIFPNMDNATKFKFAGVSKGMRTLLLSTEASQYWNENPFEFCIDSYCCPLCPVKPPKGTSLGALSILSNFPFKRLKMRGFITNIPDCLVALSKKGLVESLHLTVTYKTNNSPPLCDLLPERCDACLSSDMFPFLKELILDSSHLQHVDSAGRHRLLCLFGSRLESLSFLGLSPSTMFETLTKSCPVLRRLRVDKAASSPDFNSYQNEFLEVLELCKSNFVVTSTSHLPRLKKFRFSGNLRFETNDYLDMVIGLSGRLEELTLELPSDIMSTVLTTVSTALPKLKKIRLEGAYCCGIIDASSIAELSDKCKYLNCFEVVSTKSVTTLGFSRESFVLMSSFPNLKSLRMMYDETIMNDLATVLAQSHSLKGVIFWERMRWSSRPWTLMRQRLQSIASAYPSVKVTLEEVSIE